MEQAIAAQNFKALAPLIMRDSNNFHAICLDTYPPIFYLNATSQRLIHMVHALNAASSQDIVAYTFDAGPNPVLFYEDSSQQLLFAKLADTFGLDFDRSECDYFAAAPPSFVQDLPQEHTVRYYKFNNCDFESGYLCRLGPGAISSPCIQL